jgi:hypothetical protein
VVGTGKIDVSKPERVISSDLFCIGVADVAVTMLFAKTGASAAPAPVPLIGVELISSRIDPANIA